MHRTVLLFLHHGRRTQGTAGEGVGAAQTVSAHDRFEHGCSAEEDLLGRRD
jgi:hypothetical protein